MFNAANERLVTEFLAHNTSFTSIVDTVAEVVEAADEWRRPPRDLADVLAAEQWARDRATTIMSGGK